MPMPTPMQALIAHNGFLLLALPFNPFAPIHAVLRIEKGKSDAKFAL
jgi:hypothetical protein